MTLVEQPVTNVGPGWGEIMSMAVDRFAESGALLTQMMNVRDRYNGDVVYPWAEQLTNGADIPSLHPHLLGEAIDNYAMRAASVMPSITCPATDPGKERGQGSRDWARTRRRAVAATMNFNRFELVMRKLMRHLSGYQTCSAIVRPDFVAGMPRIEVMNPLNTFPDPRSSDDFRDPIDCIYIHGYSASYLRKHFPQLRSEVGGPIGHRDMDGTLWDIVEYVDGNVFVTGLAGRRGVWDSSGMHSLAAATELARIPNRMGRFPGMTMGRISLDRMGSALQHVVGQLDWAARLQLLDVIATEKSIFPDMFIIGETSRPPKLHTSDGMWKDGRTGEVNVITDANNIGQIRNTPDPAGARAIDRMERNARVNLGLIPQFNGETSNALRTGRGIETMMGAAVDPRVHEMQVLALNWLPLIGSAIIDCYATYWPDQKFEMHSMYPGDHGLVSFTPNREMADNNYVAFSYPIAGADLQLTNIVLSQMLGAGAISRTTFREQHPWINDAEGEERRVREEQLEELAFQSLTQQAVGGNIPIEQLAMIEEAMKADNGGDIFTAIRIATEKLKAQQAAEPPPPDPGQITAPDMQPGLGGPSGPTAPPPPGGGIGPTEGQTGLRELMNALSAGGRRVTGVQGPQ